MNATNASRLRSPACWPPVAGGAKATDLVLEVAYPPAGDEIIVVNPANDSEHVVLTEVEGMLVGRLQGPVALDEYSYPVVVPRDELVELLLRGAHLQRRRELVREAERALSLAQERLAVAKQEERSS
jgi:hypothetical protein